MAGRADPPNGIVPAIVIEDVHRVPQVPSVHFSTIRAEPWVQFTVKVVEPLPGLFHNDLFYAFDLFRADSPC